MINVNVKVEMQEGSNMVFGLIRVGMLFRFHGLPTIYRKLNESEALSLKSLEIIPMSKTQKIEQVNLSAEGVPLVTSQDANSVEFGDIEYGSFFSEDGNVYFKRNSGEALRIDNLYLALFEYDEPVKPCTVSDITINITRW